MCPTHSEAKQTEMSEFRAEKALLQDHTWRWVAPAITSPKLPKGFRQNTFKSQVGGGDSHRVGNCAQFSDWLMVR